MIFGPDGAPLADPLPSGAEGIVTADIDLQSIDYAKHLCDPVGHYSRPDLLSLNVNSTAAKQVHYSK
jgi:predicted amidohydrolase